MNQAFRSCALVLVLTTVIAAGITIGLPAYSGEGNGGAYNGPNLSGEAIPVSPDQSVSLKEVRAATQKCMTRMARDLWQQAYKSRIPSSDTTPWDGHYGGDLPEISAFQLDEHDCTYSGSLSSRETGPQFDRIDIKGDRCLTGLVRISVLLAKPGTNEWNPEWFEIPNGLPFLSFTSRVSDGSAYDEYGRLKDPSKVLVKELKLMGNVTSLGPVRLINHRSKQTAALSVNPAAYRQCLLSEVQK